MSRVNIVLVFNDLFVWPLPLIHHSISNPIIAFLLFFFLNLNSSTLTLCYMSRLKLIIPKSMNTPSLVYVCWLVCGGARESWQGESCQESLKEKDEEPY